MAEPQVRNRAQRRAAARDAAKQNPPLDQSGLSYKLALPDRSGPKSKTLYEIAAERQAELEKEGFYKDHPAPESTETSGADFWSDEDPIGPFGQALVYGISLAMCHFTLDVMVFHQYRQEIEWQEIFTKTGKMLPALLFVVYLLHSKFTMRFPQTRQVLFFAASIAAGCYLIKSGNKEGYYAVMKRAPPVGTLWVWSVVEMNIGFALAHVAVILVYMVWNGYGAF